MASGDVREARTAPEARTGTNPEARLSRFAALRPQLWALDPGVAHLNHGSYGAVPLPVLEAQARAARVIERSPERFYRADLAPAIDEVRATVATFLNTDPDGLVLVQNATEAVQVVLSAIDLLPGREVLYSDHAYGWVRAAILRECERTGATARCVTLPLDETGGVDTDSLVAELAAAVNDRTALLVIDQITSSSALRVPVEAVLAALGDAVPVLVDGAHAPGLIDHPVPGGASFWLGNLHKWAFAARTAAALVVAPAYRDRIEPLLTSVGSTQTYPHSFTYQGTQDPTAYLALPASLSFPSDHLGLSFSELRERNTAVLDAGFAQLASVLDVSPAPDNGLPLRTLNLKRLGDHRRAEAWTTQAREAGVEVAITSVNGRLFARVSVQAYVGGEAIGRLERVFAAFAGS